MQTEKGLGRLRNHTGEVAERSKAAVLKTVEGDDPSQGSNPCLSASFRIKIKLVKRFVLGYSGVAQKKTLRKINCDYRFNSG